MMKELLGSDHSIVVTTNINYEEKFNYEQDGK